MNWLKGGVTLYDLLSAMLQEALIEAGSVMRPAVDVRFLRAAVARQWTGDDWRLYSWEVWDQYIYIYIHITIGLR